MISLSIKFHEEEVKQQYQPTNSSKNTFTARQCYTLIKKYKKAGFNVGVTVGTRYTDSPIGEITGFVTPPKDGITVWNEEPSLFRVKNKTTNFEASYRRSELIPFKLDKKTGEFVKC